MTNITVHQALDQYYKEQVRPNATDPRSAENSIRHLKLYFEPHLLLKDIGVPDCRAYILARTGGQVGTVTKVSTASKELGVLRAASNHALKWKRITLADMPMFEQPAYVPNPNIWLFKDEFWKLVDTAAKLKGEIITKRTWAFILLCYYTGSRREAIETLTWDQVNLKTNRIALAKEGEKQTKKRRPTIAIDPELRPVLEYLKAQKIDDYVLGSGRRMDAWFAKAAKAAGLTVLRKRDGRGAFRLTPHVLRHSRATHLLNDGKEPWNVANLLGDTLATIERVYGHRNPKSTESLFAKRMPTAEEIAS